MRGRTRCAAGVVWIVRVGFGLTSGCLRVRRSLVSVFEGVRITGGYQKSISKCPLQVL